MKILRLGSYLVFFALVYLLYVRVKAYQAASAAGEEGTNAFVLILLFILTALIGGVLFVPRILSAFGDTVGEAMMSSGEEVGENPYAKAHSLIAAGEYEAAVPALRGIAKEHPGDRMPIMELVKIQQEKLLHPEDALRTLKSALSNEDEWGHDDKAVFMFKMAELYQKDLNDQETAVETLREVTTIFPHTRHSANATHKLREIDPALVSAAADTSTQSPAKPE